LIMSTDAIVLLKQDHKEIRRLFRQFQSAKTKASRTAAARRVVNASTVYSFLENECMNPEIRKRLPDLEEDVLRSIEDNHVAAVLCAELAPLDPDDERFDAKATVLRRRSRMLWICCSSNTHRSATCSSRWSRPRGTPERRRSGAWCGCSRCTRRPRSRWFIL